MIPLGILAAARRAGGATGIKAGMISWYDLEEASGPRADAHGSRPLFPVGTVGRFAARNGFGSYAAAGGYLQTSGSESFATGDFTIAGVFKSSQPQYGIISRNGPFAASDRQWLVALDNPSGTFYFAVSTNGTSNAQIIAGPSGCDDDVLHDYFCWRDTAGDTINLQVDGGSVVSVAFDGGITLYSASDPGITLHGIGAGTYVTGGGADSAGLWKRMLTPTERASLRNGGAWRSYAELEGL